MRQWKNVFPASPVIGIAADTEGDAIDISSASPVNFIHITGKPGSGKTFFATQIIGNDPTSPDKAIVAFDIEGGVKPYASQFSIKNVELYGFKNKPATVWAEFVKVVMAMEPGEHAVALIDPVEELEEGLFAWVKENPEKFGKTASQYKSGDGVTGLFWGDMKMEAKRIFTLLASKVQTVIMVSHLSAVYQGTKVVPGKFKPKGKDVVIKLATLQVWLIGDGTAAPAAVVTKSRLSWSDYSVTDEYGVPTSRPVLPRYIPIFTPMAIREYMMHPRSDFTAKEMEVIDPSTIALSPQEQQALESEILEQQIILQNAKNEEAITRNRNAMIGRMVTGGYYENPTAATAAAREIALESGKKFSDDQMAFEAMMIERADRLLRTMVRD